MKKRNIILMLLLTFLTCGIYNIFWMIMARQEFKMLSGDQTISPFLELFLSIICFPYFFYWIYKFSTEITRYQHTHGLIVKDNSALNLVLAVFGLGLISELLIQDQLNELI